jgi:hypothetical protein
MKHKTISEIINGEYLESDTPELLITENGHIENIVNHKKMFKFQ